MMNKPTPADALLLVKYYVRRLRTSLLYLTSLYVALCTLIIMAHLPLSLPTIVSFLTFSKTPSNEFEALATVVAMMINTAPLLGIYEIKAISPEEKARLKASHIRNHVIVIGCGHLGSRVCRKLFSVKHPFVLITRPEDYREKEFVRFLVRQGIPVVLGDATHEETLKTAGIERAKALIITVNNDTINMVIAQKAKKLNPKIRVVSRIYSEELAELAMKSGFSDEALSTTKLVYGMFIAGSLVDIEPLPEIIPVKINEKSKITGKMVGEIEDKYGIMILAVVKKSGEIIRDRNYRIHMNDTVIMFGDFAKMLKALAS